MGYDKNKENRFYIVGTGSDYIRIMWNDILQEKNVFYVESPVEADFPFKKIYRLVETKQYSYKINRRINVPGKNCWRRYYTVNQFRFEKNYNNIIIFTDAMRVLTDKKNWHELKDKNNLTYCLLLLNSCRNDFNADDAEVKKILDFLGADLTVTFDKRDAEKYGISFFPSLYSGIDSGDIPQKYDFYFVGQQKNRLKEIISVFDVLTGLGYKCFFRITGVRQGDMVKKEGLVFNEHIDYTQVVQELLASKAIVDINIAGQRGLSLRYFEAIQYNKLLLTNNDSVRETPFYHAKYMFCYNSVNELMQLTSFLDETPDYKYNGLYSPKNLLQQIVHLLEER